MALGTTVAGCIAAGLILGLIADSHLHSSPVGLLIGLLLGIAAAVGTVVTQVRRLL